MKRITLTLSVLAAMGLTVAACSDDDDNNTAVTKAAVVENYANIVYQNYKDSYDDAVELEAAINDFTTAPTAAKFETAKTKWKEARESYGTTEAFRFASGPIDNEDYEAPEGLLNAWPLDEAYIDYVAGSETGLNIINNTAIQITKDVLEGLNEDGGEKNISIGYHAIEFLLWGQDLTAPSERKPGLRTFEDYVDNGTTANNEGRRRQYLNVCADLLTDHLNYLVQQWQPGGDYRNTFLALDKDVALGNIYNGIVTLAGSELAIERIDVALLAASQEDEHSCFSDNTHRDIALNLQGIINVYKGQYGNIDGPSIEDLVKQASAPIHASTDASVNNATTKVAAMLTPFDLAIAGGADSAEGAKVKQVVDELQLLSVNILAGAGAINVTVNGVD